VYALPGFIAPHSSGAHLHSANCSFGSIVGPEHGGFGLESAISRLMLAQPQEQIA